MAQLLLRHSSDVASFMGVFILLFTIVTYEAS